MAVWICQCLCPDHHCILAAANEADTQAQAEEGVRAPLRAQIEYLLASHTTNPWCALCGADRATWRFELHRTRFSTMKDATPALMEAEARNLATNAAWGDTHRTSRPN